MKRGAPDHPKMRRLARRLGLPHMAAVGCMEMLWHWASRYAQDGAIGRYDDDDIADALYWTEPAERLITALVEAGFVDRDEQRRLMLHGWSEHCEDAVHATLARARAWFADGSAPNLAKLGKDERAEAESFYVVTNPAISGDFRPPPAPAGRHRPPALASASAIAFTSPLPSVEEGECRGGDAPADAAASPEPPADVEVMPPEAEHEPPLEPHAPPRTAPPLPPPLELEHDSTVETHSLATGPPPAARRSRAQPRTCAPDALSREQRNAIARWVLASDDAAIRAQLGSLDAQIDACLDWHRGKGNQHADWVATVRTWLRKSPAFDAPRGAPARFETPGERAFRGRVEEAQGALELLRASHADERSRAAEKARRRAIHEAAYTQRALPESL